MRTPLKSDIDSECLKKIRVCSQTSQTSPSINPIISGQYQSPNELSTILRPFASTCSPTNNNQANNSCIDCSLESTSKSATNAFEELAQESRDHSIDDVVKRLNKVKERLVNGTNAESSAVILGDSHLLINLSFLDDFSIKMSDTSTQTYLIETKDQTIEVSPEADGFVKDVNTQTDDLRVDCFTQTEPKPKLKNCCLLM